MSRTRVIPVAKPLAVATLLGAGLVTTLPAWATTAADTTIRNTVTVSYADAANTAQTPITAQVDITVNLVRANPLLNAPADITTDPATNANYAYTITNTANGLATYSVNGAVTAQSAGISGSTVGAVANITLGSTTVATGTTIAAGTTTVVTVPRDNTSDSSINGLIVGDTVVISGQTFTVTAIGADTAGPGTTTVTLNNTGAALVVTAGTLIAERKSFTISVDPGPVSNASVDQTINVTTTATDTVDNTKTANDPTITTVASVGLTVSKLVRNVTNAVVGSGAVSYGGNTYYAGGVNGNPGDVLEYMIVVSKSASASSATGVKISDPIPPFTTYVAASMRIDNTGGGTFTALNDNDSNGDAGETDGNTVYFYPGTGGADGAAGLNNGTGGSLGASAGSHMLFRVNIN